MRARSAEAIIERRVAQKLPQRIGERRAFPWNDQTRLSCHKFLNTAAVADNHRYSASNCFRHAICEILVAGWKHEDLAIHQRRLLLIAIERPGEDRAAFNMRSEERR